MTSIKIISATKCTHRKLNEDQNSNLPINVNEHLRENQDKNLKNKKSIERQWGKKKTVSHDQSTYISTIQQITVNKHVLSNSLPSRIPNSTTGAKINQQVNCDTELPNSMGA